MKNYVEVAYSNREKPKTEYPTQLARYLMNRFHLTKGMKILDNGCGRGDFLNAFSEQGLEAHGTDLSSACTEAVVVDLERDSLPFPDDYFDAVFSKSVIEHLTSCENYMSEMRRVLKKDGWLILMAPDWKSQYKIFYEDPTHVHPYTVKSIERLLAMFEFREIEVEEFTQLPSTWNNVAIQTISRLVKKLGPVDKVYKNKFFRFSRELMILGSGRK